MNVPGYFGFVTFALLISYAVRWLDPAFLAHLSRRTGLRSRHAWGIAFATYLWIFLPVLAGARTGDDELWVVGAAVAGVGVFLLTIAAASRDEYRLLQRVEHYAPDDLPAGGPDTLVATSGDPEPVVDEDSGGQPAETPFSGAPAVHTDWVVQRRNRVGLRRIWQNHATGVRSSAFTLGDGAVRVTPGRHRVFTNAETRVTLDPDDDVPEPAASFMAAHPDLPSPDAREQPLRFMETSVPADEPVTVVGTVEQASEPGVSVIDDAPVDDLLGTHADHDHASSAVGGEAILVHGDWAEARRLMHRRVRWLGAAGLAMVLGGQALSFWLSSASLAALV